MVDTISTQGLGPTAMIASVYSGLRRRNGPCSRLRLCGEAEGHRGQIAAPIQAFDKHSRLISLNAAIIFGRCRSAACPSETPGIFRQQRRHSPHRRKEGQLLRLDTAVLTYVMEQN